MSTKKERTREHIIEASYPLFAARGFKSVTMKDICEASGMSRGGVYSHFSSTREIFEELLQNIGTNSKRIFEEEMQRGVCACELLNRILERQNEEMMDLEQSFALPIFEYASSEHSEVMANLNRMAVEKWTTLIDYGIARGEFNEVDVDALVNVILYSYQGVRMWGRMTPLEPIVYQSIVEYIKRELIKRG